MRRNPTHFEWMIQAIQSHESNDCLMWPFSVDKDGYGILTVNRALLKSHRVAFKIANGRWPQPYGCHTCDTPGCFNPRHIFEGTASDNMQDCKAKGRSKHAANARTAAKLTDETVRQIRAEYIRWDKDCGSRGLARKYGVSQACISLVITRKHWRHVV